MSLEKLAIQSVAARHGWTIHRSKKSMLRELAKVLGEDFWRHECADDDESERLSARDNKRGYFRDIFGEFRRVPDGWVVVPSEDRSGTVVATVVAIEVEDTNKLSSIKLMDYGYLWWGFDGTTELDLQLLSVDRYGNTETWFNMTTVGYLEIFGDRDDAEKSVEIAGELTLPSSPFPMVVPA